MPGAWLLRWVLKSVGGLDRRHESHLDDEAELSPLDGSYPDLLEDVHLEACLGCN